MKYAFRIGVVLLASLAVSASDRAPEPASGFQTPSIVAPSHPDLASSTRRGRPARSPVVRLEGMITAVESDSITLETRRDESFAVGISSVTEVLEGNRELFPSQLLVGDFVVVTATREPRTTGWIAREIRVYELPSEAVDAATVRVEGSVSSISPESFILLTRQGTLRVALDEGTGLREGDRSLAPGEIRPGDRLLVVGKAVDERSLVALEIVRLLPATDPGILPAFNGEVVRVAEDFLEIAPWPEPMPFSSGLQSLITVRVTSTTEIVKGGEVIPLSRVEVGDLVVVFGEFRGESEIVAARIEILEPPLATVVGVVSEIRPGELIVAWDCWILNSAPTLLVTVRVSDQTEIDREGEPIGFDDIAVGDRIEAAGDWIGPEVLDARRVSVLPDPPPVTSVWGEVVSVGESEILVQEYGARDGVAGRTISVRVDDETTITRDAEPASLGDIEVGDQLFAAGDPIDETTLLADVIEAYSAPPPSEYVFGIIVEIRDREIVIETDVMILGESDPARVRVRVDDDTEITRDGLPARFADLRIDDRLEASGEWMEDGVLLAAWINAWPEPLPSIFGEVVEVSETGLVVLMGTMDDRSTGMMPSLVTVRVDSSTVIERGGEPIRLSDIALGDFVWVTGSFVDEQTMHAVRVEVIEPPKPIVSGTVVEVREREIIVSPDGWIEPTGGVAWLVTVRVNEETRITRDGEQIRLSAIEPGERVVAEGEWVDESTLLAARVEVFSVPPPPPIIWGTVVEIHEQELVVQTNWLAEPIAPMPDVFLVRVNDDTKITRGGQPIAFSDIRLDDLIEAEGEWREPTTLLATRIEVIVPPPVVAGIVAEVRDHEIVVNTDPGGIGIMSHPSVSQMIVRVGEETVIRRNGEEIPLSGVLVGDFLWAEGEWLEEDVLAAAWIEVYSFDPEPAVSGVVAEIGENVLFVDSGDPTTGMVVATHPVGSMTEVRVSDETKITRGGEPISFRDIAVGDYVMAKGEWRSDGVLYAHQIEVLVLEQSIPGV